MKTSTLLIIGVLGAAVFYIWKQSQASPAAASTSASNEGLFGEVEQGFDSLANTFDPYELGNISLGGSGSTQGIVNPTGAIDPNNILGSDDSSIYNQPALGSNNPVDVSTQPSTSGDLSLGEGSGDGGLGL